MQTTEQDNHVVLDTYAIIESSYSMKKKTGKQTDVAILVNNNSQHESWIISKFVKSCAEVMCVVQQLNQSKGTGNVS